MKEFIAAVLLAAITATLTVGVAVRSTLDESKKAIASYVNVWEEEIARELLLEKRTDLYEKIRSQIPRISKTTNDIISIGDASSSTAVCDVQLSQSIAVTLYGNPAGTLRFCHDRTKLFMAAARSPAFSIGMLFSLLISLGLPSVSYLRRREAATKKRELEAELEVSNAVALLARSVAHDIRAPLSALNAVTQTDDDLNDLRPLLSQASQRINSIADDLLKRSRDAQKVTFDPRPAVRHVVDEARKLAPSITIQFDDSEAIQASKPIEAQGLKDLDRVVSNLLTNSIEALTKETSQAETNNQGLKPTIQIRIKVRRRPWALRPRFRRLLALSIHDNGPGIPLPIRNHAGLKPVTYGKANGNGLGLMSARNFAKSRGGRLKIRSNDSGTKVDLEIPISEPSSVTR